MPEQATRLVRSRNRMTAAKAELDKLNVSGVELEGKVYPTFHTDGPWKRDEVRKNLEDGQKVITLMQSRARSSRHLRKLLALLGAVATTDESLGKAIAYTPPPPPAEEPTRVRHQTRPVRPAPSLPALLPTPAPKPAGAAPAPKPVAKRGGDDEGAPAPKPTQGSAPAEIEP